MLSTPAPVRVWEHNFAVYRRIWRSNVLGAFVQPLLYLLGMGLGVGALVDRGTNSLELLDGLSYFAFIAPALLATTAMMVSSQEALWPVIEAFMWSNSYRSMAATPLSPGQIVSGVALWQATRAAIAVTGVAIVLTFFDETRSLGLLLTIPFGALTGLAFSVPLTAWSSTRNTETSFPSIQRFVIVPLFLFGGAFYPIDQLPGWMQPIAKATPLWHGVQLCRDAVLHRLELSDTLAHVGVLIAFVVAGLAVCRITYARRLAE
ncbi:MAG TPA: ABC transporter permease [Ilumatobacteraceae bacterium]|nr:ABC transporter permease [Ilumatobacteraceae bacterium]